MSSGPGAWSWPDAPETDGHPREVEILGAGAEAARQAGDYDRAVELARRGLAVAGDAGADSREAARCWSALAGVAHYRGDFAAAARDWARSARASGPEAAGLLASAALAAGYGGDRAHATALLAEARQHESTSPNGSNHAFITYVEGELVAVDDPAAAIASYVAAVEEARSVGANFVAGVAGVALASARARTGDPAPRPRRTATCWTTGAPPDTGPSCGPPPATQPRCSSPRAIRGRPRCCCCAPTPPRRRRPSTPTSRDTAVAASSRSPRWSPPTSWSRCGLRRPR